MAERNRYEVLILEIFESHYSKGVAEFEFERSEIEDVAERLKIQLPKNIGDVIYSFRYRIELPKEITSTAPAEHEWLIEPAGTGTYKFKLGKINRIVPRTDLVTTKIPDATPEIVSQYTLGDEQALLAKLRYNRLVDIFLGLTTYSLQNHLRTTVKEIGQIEVDELYVGVNREGAQFIIPVQAKGGNDQLSVIQARQDIACCAEKFPSLVCRSISAQFMAENRIAVFELCLEDDEVRVVREKHYKLVPAADIKPEELSSYSAT